MKNLMMVFALAMALAGNSFAGSEDVVKFAAAESVWPQGLEKEMNTLVSFRAPFALKAGEKAELKLAAWYSYRVKVNGKFVAFGPARGPKGFFRPDVLDLTPFAGAGENSVKIEVAGYNVPNFYLMEQPPFVKAELVVNGQVRASTKVKGSEFVASLEPRVKKVPRYSFQRPFAEVYRLPGAPSPSALALAPAPEPTLIPRRAPYPRYEMNPRMEVISFAKVRVDEKVKTHSDRSLTLPGNSKVFKGYKLDELEENLCFLAQRLVSSDRRTATAADKARTSFALSAGNCAVFDNGLCDTGFPGLRVEVKTPGRLVLQFDEVIAPNGEARGICRYWDCCNAIQWDFDKPGIYEVDSFEPYTMRYAQIDVVSGDMVVSAPRFRSYKNPTAAEAEFRASDSDLVKIFNAAKETFRQNAVDVFTDCPSRERAGWNCDAFFTSPVSTMLTGNGDLEKLFVENLALPPSFDYIPDGALPMCYPADFPDGGFIPNWAMWFVLQTEEYLRRTGDRAMVERLRPRFEKLLAWLWRYRNSDGLLEKLPGWVFVEWSRCNKLVQDVNYPSNMTFADMLEALDRMYGRADLAAEAKRIRAEVLRQSWTGKWFCDNAVRQKDGTLKLSGECTETCQYYAFFHRIATPESHPELWKTMLTDFGPQRYDPNDRKKLLKYPEIWPSNAFIGNYLRLKLLEREGLGAQILNETKGYFMYMVNRTGTLWENDTTCASCNHGFASYAAVLLVRSVLGLDVDLASKTVTVRETDAKLDFCGVTLPAGNGKIVFDRVLRNGKYETTCKLPEGWRLVRREGDKVVVRPSDTSAALVNPDMGFVCYHMAGRMWAYGSKLESGDTLDWFPGVSTVYFRLLWSELEPTEGDYRFDILDRVAQNWIAKGKKLAFRVICCNQTANACPDYVREAGAKGVWFQYKGHGVPKDFPKRWEPVYDDPIFLAKYEKFMRAFADRYDGDPNVAFVDVGSFGMYGEGHTGNTQKLNKQETDRITRLHIQLHKRLLPKTLLVISDDVAGSGGQEPEAPLMRFAREQGVGYRDDSIFCMGPETNDFARGGSWSHSHWARNFAPETPVVLEAGHWTMCTAKGRWLPERILSCIEDHQASYFSIHGFPDAYYAAHREIMNAASRRLGYRFQLREAKFPAVVRTDEPITIESTWVNAGVAILHPGARLSWSLVDANGAVAWSVTDATFNFRDLKPTLGGVECPVRLSSRCRFGRTVENPPHDPVITAARAAGFDPGHEYVMLKPGVYDLCVSVGSKQGTPEIALPLANEIGSTRRYCLSKLSVLPANMNK